MEKEKKFLVAEGSQVPKAEKVVDITQYYLVVEEGSWMRVRREEDVMTGVSVYSFCYKKLINENDRIEIEKEISRQDFEALVRDSLYYVYKRRSILPADPELPDCTIMIDAMANAGGLWVHQYIELETTDEFPETLPEYFGYEVTGLQGHRNIDYRLPRLPKLK